jgi:cell pole-organizing protein PopZ
MIRREQPDIGCGRAYLRGAGMSQAAKAQEPSMEEILASIRRIIADDDTAKPAPKPAAAAPPPPRPAAMPPRNPPPPPPKPVAPPPESAMDQQQVDAVMASPPASAPAEDVLELTEQMAAPAESEPEAPPSFQTIDGQSDVVFTDPPAELPPRPAAIEEPRRPQQPPPQPVPPLPDRNIMSADTTAAVDSAFNALAQTVLVQNARTLEDLVREMLRPMLKSWLDDNLPGMVERIVRAEIERVSRGRG